MPEFIRNIGWPELLIIAILVIIFFGSRKMREVSRGMGESVKEVKKIKKDLTSKEKEEE